MKILIIILLLILPLEVLSVDEYKVYLPIVINEEETVGVDAESSLCRGWYREGTNTKVSVRWMDVESIKGEYDWSSLDRKLCGHQAYLINIKNTPKWALNEGEPSCFLPNSSHLKDLYRFIRELDKLYSPRYIEVWNEPDALYGHMPEGHEKHYGCIGNGVEYGEFIDYLYQEVKQDINAKIVMGAVSSIYNRFTYDMLIESKGNYDVLSFHCYAQSWEGLYKERKCI